MNIRHVLSGLFLCLAISSICLGQGTRLLRHPTVSRDSVAFAYAGDLWVVSRSGGPARRVTSTQGAEIESVLFAGWFADRLHIYNCGKHGRLCRANLRWRPKAVDLSPRRRSRPWMDTRRPSRDLRVRAQERAAAGVLSALDGGLGWRSSREPPDAARVQRFVFARWPTPGLRGIHYGIHPWMVRSKHVA